MQSSPLGTEQPHVTVQAGNYPVGEQLCRKGPADAGVSYSDVHKERTKGSQIPDKYQEKKITEGLPKHWSTLLRDTVVSTPPDIFQAQQGLEQPHQTLK